MDKNQAYNFLSQIPIAVLCTISPNNIPYAVTMYYYIDTDLNLYFITQANTKKYQNILQNDQVSVVVTDRRLVQTMQIEGTAMKIVDPDSLSQIIDKIAHMTALHKSAHWPPPITKIESGDMVVIKVIPKWMRFADFEKEPSQNSPLFTDIKL